MNPTQSARKNGTIGKLLLEKLQYLCHSLDFIIQIDWNKKHSKAKTSFCDIDIYVSLCSYFLFNQKRVLFLCTIFYSRDWNMHVIVHNIIDKFTISKRIRYMYCYVTIFQLSHMINTYNIQPFLRLYDAKELTSFHSFLPTVKWTRSRLHVLPGKLRQFVT